MSETTDSSGNHSPSRLLTATTHSEAQVIAQLLEAEGIPSLVQRVPDPNQTGGLLGRLMRNMRPRWSSFGLHEGPCDVLVPHASLQRAAELLDASRRAGEELERLAASGSAEDFELEEGAEEAH